MLIILSVLTILVTLLLFLVFFILKQIQHLYELYYSSGGLQLPVKISELDLQDDSYLPEKGPYILLFVDIFCPACQRLLKQIEKQEIFSQIPQIILLNNNEDEIQRYAKENQLHLTFYSLSDRDRDVYKVNVEPFIYVINNKNTIFEKRAISSAKQIIEIYERVKS